MADTGSPRKSGTYLPCVFLRLTSGERLQDLSDLKHLKQEILDNISLIFNSCSRPGPDELGNDPYIIYSVLGFGIGNFCGRQSSEETVNGICRQIREQIIHFEPRLDPKSVLVEAKNSDGQRRNSLTVSVSARISQNPFSADEVSCRFVLDLETGIPRLDQAGGRT